MPLNYVFDMDTPGQRNALHALRAIASLTIVVYHFRYYSPFPWFATFPWLAKGYLGVDLFFVLSGLIISHVYSNALTERRETYSRFIFLRIARVFPLHAFIMVLMLVATLMSGKTLTTNDIKDWLTLTLMIRQWLMPEGYVWNSPAWSISAEMFAYAVVYPLVLALTRTVSDRSAAQALFAVGTTLLCAVIYLDGSINGGSGALPLLRVTGGFAIGCGLFHLLRGESREASYDRWFYAGLGVAVLALHLRSDLGILTGLSVVVAATYITTGPVARFLECRPLHYLGEISFSLYLCHMPTFAAARTIAKSYGFHPGPMFCMITLLLSLAVASALYGWVECPARMLLRRWYQQRERTALVASASTPKIQA